MTECTINNIYDDLKFCKGKTVLPGLRPKVYYIPKGQIVKFPTLPEVDSEGATMESIGTYEGDFVLAADAVAKRIDILTPASNVTSASQGEKPSKTFQNSSTLKYAGNNAAAVGFARLANSDDFVYIVQQRDGKWRVVGNESFETNTNPSQDSGMAETDASGTTLEITVTDVCPAPYYVGKLNTSDGVLDCATNTIQESTAQG